MKGPYYDILSRVRTFDPETEVIESVRPYEDEVIRVNTDEQLLSEGVDRTGLMIEPPYTPFTIRIKQQKGQVTTHVTLKDEGDFHKSFRIVFNANSFELVADDPKTDDLVKKYGPEILGLTDANLTYLIDEFIRPEFQRRFTNTVLP